MVKSVGSAPFPLTSFVGRVGELREIDRLLSTHRLVTVSGPGGVGKTRVAIEVARRRAEAAEIRWIDLASVETGARVVSLAAETMGLLIKEDGTILSLARQIADRGMLLVLDNCEHVVDAVAELVAAILHAAPEVTILATSTEALGLPGERLFRMPPLNQDEAIELFRERAASALRPEHQDSVRLACARLDGIPLAVELAAAWSGVLSSAQILEGLDDRFALLVRSSRGAAPRHETLSASIQWSYDLLDEAERALLRRLSIFAGPFTLEVAARVCGAGSTNPATVRELLGSLIYKSLVVAETMSAEAQYRLLESVREFARARLAESGEQDALRRRQVSELLGWVRELRPVLDENIDVWRQRLMPLAETFRSAVEYGLSLRDPTDACELAAELPHLWHSSVFGRDGIRLLRAALDSVEADRDALRARLLVGLALVADTTAPFGVEYDAAQAAFEIADEVGDQRTAALSLLLSAVGAFYDDLAAGARLAERAQSLAAEVDYPYVELGATALLGIIAHLRDQHPTAERLLTEAVRGLEALGERGIASTALGFLALSALYTGRFVEAERHAARSVELALPLNDYHRLGTAYSVRAIVQGTTGDVEASRATLRPLLNMFDGDADPPFVPVLWRAIGLLSLWEGRPTDAVEWYTRLTLDASSAETYLSAELKSHLVVALNLTRDHDRARTLAADVLTASRVIGLPRVIANVLVESAVCAEDGARAHALQFEALTVRAEHGLRPDVVRSLESLARLWSDAGRQEDAGRLRAAAAKARTDLAMQGSDDTHASDEVMLEVAMSLDDAVAYALRARGPRGRPTSGWDSLTPTELEVVRLAAAGLTNPEIGSRLFISRATVKTHLSHAYDKLDVSNRVELSLIVGQHDDI